MNHKNFKKYTEEEYILKCDLLNRVAMDSRISDYIIEAAVLWDIHEKKHVELEYILWEFKNAEEKAADDEQMDALLDKYINEISSLSQKDLLMPHVSFIEDENELLYQFIYDNSNDKIYARSFGELMHEACFDKGYVFKAKDNNVILVHPRFNSKHIEECEDNDEAETVARKYNYEKYWQEYELEYPCFTTLTEAVLWKERLHENEEEPYLSLPNTLHDKIINGVRTMIGVNNVNLAKQVAQKYDLTEVDVDGTIGLQAKDC